MYHMKALLLSLIILFINLFVYSHVTNITTKDEFSTLINNNNLVVLKCYTTWCGACTAIETLFADLAKEYTHQSIVFAEIDVDQNQFINDRYKVTYIPQFLLFKEGNILKKIGSPHALRVALESFDNTDTVATHDYEKIKSSHGFFTTLIELIMIPVHFVFNIAAQLWIKTTTLFNT